MKKSLGFVALCLTLIIGLVGCKEKRITLGNGISFDKEENLQYGQDLRQVMDLYIPQQEPKKEKDIFIIIHGGGWHGGNKSQLTFFTLSMMQRFPNHIFANIEYRLASQTRYAIPNQTNDIKSAIDFLKKRLNYTPRLILLGNSAGGHLSMLYAYKFDTESNVKAVINIVGPADLSDSGFKTYEDYSFVEKHLIDPQIIPSGTSAVSFGSPIHWITKNSPPTLSYYGKTDRVVPSTQKKTIDSILNKNGIINESYEFNGGHLDWDKQPNNQFLIDKIEAFLKKIGKK